MTTQSQDHRSTLRTLNHLKNIGMDVVSGDKNDTTPTFVQKGSSSSSTFSPKARKATGLYVLAASFLLNLNYAIALAYFLNLNLIDNDVYV